MAKFFLQFVIFSACIVIAGIGKHQPPPSAVSCESLQFQKKTFCPVAGPTVNLLRGPPPEVAQQAGSTLSVVCEASSTEPTLEIQWYYISTEGLKLPVKTLSSVGQNFPFTINSRLFLRANILTTVTSTLTIQRLSAAYVGGYACTAAAGDIQVESNVCQIHVQVRMGLPLVQVRIIGVRYGASGLK